MAEPHAEPEPEDEERASSPFDNPYFLPFLLWLFAAWFFYDGFFNEKIQSIQFNRWGSAFWAILAIYYTVRGLRERRDEQARAREVRD